MTISRQHESQRSKLKTKKKNSTLRRSSRKQQRSKPIKKLKKVSNWLMMTMMLMMIKMRLKIPQIKTKRESLTPLHKRKNRQSRKLTISERQSQTVATPLLVTVPSLRRKRHLR